MLKSVLLKNKKSAFIVSFITAAAISLCFVAGMTDQDWLSWGNKCLSESFDPSIDPKLKKWEVLLTDDSFIRLRKTYQNNKQEYFSFQLQKLDSISYTGDATTGMLKLKAKADDIIVQTYNDRQGNIDSMANVLNIPLKNMEPKRLDSLEEALNYFKMKNL
ncbi:hypothetical protein FO440_00695 [Mucilaginibacter corticis]|uniref:Uncharacterized protein n=1 Tax=Mucilaginibacter corticis TaxID=2597670 RepID=A0A556MS04_9SPHI|nr:hypothetical protein [Mucilaginibacter corticis]TSJ42741.1 hypothetical protein FO440_00695 [Mucilaginibacter corticis]